MLYLPQNMKKILKILSLIIICLLIIELLIFSIESLFSLSTGNILSSLFTTISFYLIFPFFFILKNFILSLIISLFIWLIIYLKLK